MNFVRFTANIAFPKALFVVLPTEVILMLVTTKGQVTIPIDVREKLGIFPGTEVDIVARNGKAEIIKTKPKKNKPSRGQRVVELLKGKATDKGITTDEILSLTRGDD